MTPPDSTLGTFYVCAFIFYHVYLFNPEISYLGQVDYIRLLYSLGFVRSMCIYCQVYVINQKNKKCIEKHGWIGIR